MSNVAQILAQQVAERPGAPALTQRRSGGDVTLTYAELDSAVANAAARLKQAGLAPGDRVLVLCGVRLELYVAVLALLRCGLTAMFVDPGAGLGKVNACCRLARPKAVIAPWRAWLLRPLVRALWVGPKWLSLPRIVTRTAPPSIDATPVDDEHPAMLTFTSGSTGEPRGVVRSHGFLALQQHAVVRHFALSAGQRDLSTMPVFVLANLAVGVHSVLADCDLRRPGEADPQRLIQQITRRDVGRILASPALLDRLADACLSRGLELESIQRIDTGGAPVFPRTLEKLRKTMPNAALWVVYGSTEVEPIAILDATSDDRATHQRIMQGDGLPAGMLADDLDVRLIQPAWGETLGPFDEATFTARCVPAQRVGEIIVRGERVIRGYLNGVGDEQSKIHVDGEVWHRTGDLGRFDSAGQLWLMGRATGRVTDDRGTLEPLAVEAAAMEYPTIARCALLAVEGERVLMVEPTGANTNGWRDALLEQLAWARIDRLVVLRRLPVDRRHNAKVDYPALRHLLAARDAAGSTTRTVPASPSISTRSPS
ncbi:MAG: AMP-binding protein [Phycisphaeraceae bacterium]